MISRSSSPRWSTRRSPGSAAATSSPAPKSSTCCSICASSSSRSSPRGAAPGASPRRSAAVVARPAGTPAAVRAAAPGSTPVPPPSGVRASTPPVCRAGVAAVVARGRRRRRRRPGVLRRRRLQHRRRRPRPAPPTADPRHRPERRSRPRAAPAARGRDEGRRHPGVRRTRRERRRATTLSTKTEYLAPRTLLAFDQYQDWLHVYLPDAPEQLDRGGSRQRRQRLEAARVRDAVNLADHQLWLLHNGVVEFEADVAIGHAAVPDADRHLLLHRSRRPARDSRTPRTACSRSGCRPLRRAHRVRRRRRPDRDPRHQQPVRHRPGRVARLRARARTT